MVGPTSQQDVELSALYHDAVITYGEGKVLGILATKTSEHEIRKRAVDTTPETPKETTTSTTTTTTPEPDQSNENGFTYYPTSVYKILLYTSSAPVLSYGNNTIILDNKKTTITTDQKNKNEQRTLKVRYNIKEKVKFELILFYFCFSLNVNGIIINMCRMIFSWKLNMYSIYLVVHGN